MKRLKISVLLCVLLASCLCGEWRAAGKTVRKSPARTVSGMVYFTNNTPKDKLFLVELFAGRTKRRVAAKWTEPSGYFEFKGLRPGVYYLQISGTNICLLQYEVDAAKSQPERLTILGDADCGRQQVAGLPEPRPVPRPQKR